MEWILNPDQVIRHSILLCFLSFAALIPWYIVLHEFWREAIERGRKGFFIIVLLLAWAQFMFPIGTIINRGMNVTRYYGWTPDLPECFVSLSAHIMQEAWLILSIPTGIWALLLIRHRKRKGL